MGVHQNRQNLSALAITRNEFASTAADELEQFVFPLPVTHNRKPRWMVLTVEQYEELTNDTRRSTGTSTNESKG